MLSTRSSRCPETRDFRESGVSLRDDAALVEDGDAVGELVGLVQVLGGEQDRGAPAGEVADDLPELAAAARVEAGGGFVEEEDAGLGRTDQPRCQVETPAHPTGVRTGLAAGRVAEAEADEEFLGALAGPGAGQTGEPRHHPQVLLAGQRLVEGGELSGQADGAAYPAPVGDHVVAGDERRA
ncbi:hypothetical protein RKD45_003831 [Streptomyces griseus]